MHKKHARDPILIAFWKDIEVVIQNKSYGNSESTRKAKKSIRDKKILAEKIANKVHRLMAKGGLILSSRQFASLLLYNIFFNIKTLL